MKILQINNVHYRRGGADVVYFNTGKLLEEHGHEVFYFSMKDANMLPNDYSDYFPNLKNYRGLTVISKIQSVKSFLYNKEAYIKLNKFLKIIRPDIAHVHLFMGGLTVSILDALKENNVPIVHTVHDYRLICPAYTFLDKKNQICEKCKDGFFIRCTYKNCSLESNYAHSAILSLDAYYRKHLKKPIDLIDKFIFVSEFAKKIHCDFNQMYSKKALRLYNFHTLKYKNIKTVRGNYFLYYGRLSREKGIDLLFDVAKKLKINLKIAGTGPLLDKLKHNADNNIEVLGFKNGEELWDLINNSNFVIVPSEWYENNPLTIVESFTFGKPVIGSDIGGITELLQNNRGVLFKPKSFDSLEKAILKASNLDEKEYEIYSQNVTNYAKKEFSEENHYNSLLNIYKSVLNDKTMC